MTASTTIINAALIACAAVLYGCGSQPSRASQRAPQGAVGTQPQVETARSSRPPALPAQPWGKSMRLTLHQQFGKAAFRECRLDIMTYDGEGSAYVRYVPYSERPTEMLRQRKLTGEEVHRLVGLVREGDLFAGGHIGIDGTGSDGPPFETLRVSVEAETGVLVTSGNPTFTTGARQQLLDWLQALLRELQEHPQ